MLFRSLCIKTLYFFPTVLVLSAAATVANIKICYDAKVPQFAIFGTRVICVLQYFDFNPSNAEATNAISKRMQRFKKKHLNPVMLVPIFQGFNIFF